MGAQWNTKVELAPELTGDQGIRKGTGVLSRVGYDPRSLLENAGCAQARVARDLVDIQSRRRSGQS